MGEGSDTAVARHRTAIGRAGLSRPLRLALEAGLVTPETSVFDYGCGRGDDVDFLQTHGYTAWGWDPAFQSAAPVRTADMVNFGYVANVIEDPAERAEALRSAWGFAGRLLIVAARLNAESRSLQGEEFRDGTLSGNQTFQKFFSQSELQEWIAENLGTVPVPAAPGVFYVFRDEGLRQSHLARRQRRQVRAPKATRSERRYELHQELLGPLLDFLTARGRLPAAWELPEAQPIIDTFGSLKQAFALIRRATGREPWDRIREARAEDLLVYFALDRFGGWPKFSELPDELQLDVRDQFSSYRKAREQAEALLFAAGRSGDVDRAMRDAPVGKLTGSAFYVHVSAIDRLPAVLRVYEGCARNYVGELADATLVKLHRQKPQVSYLAYPGFERDPHPAIDHAVVVPLARPTAQLRDYSGSSNPFILHRKEQFVAEDHPLYDKFARLTAQEERWGLFEDTDRIGTRDGWEAALAAKGAALKGHRVVRRK